MGLFRRRRTPLLAFRGGRTARFLAWTVVRLRWLVAAAWIAAAVAATVSLPGLSTADSVSLSGLVPEDADALENDERIARLFDAPFSPHTVVVQRDADGLSQAAQQHAVAGAAAVRTGEAGLEEIALAVPVLNLPGVVPGSKERLTTLATYLFFDGDPSLADQDRLADRYVGAFLDDPADSVVGVTGAAPARLQEWREIDSALLWVTLATIGVVAALMAASFRSAVAPLVVLAAAGIAYLVSVRIVGWIGSTVDVSVPSEVEPVLVVLLLGIVTDYSVFYLARMRHRLLAGEHRLVAAQGAAADYTPIVVTAGLIVAAGTATLLAGTLDFFRAFGPGMALTVLVSLGVAITLVPALLAVLGRALLWPGRTPTAADQDELAPTDEIERERALESRDLGARTVRFSTRKPVAATIVAACVVALGAACYGLVDLRLASTEITGLPSDTEERRAYEALSRGFAPGVLAPTTVLVEGDDPLDQESLGRLRAGIASAPGVAGVLGPGTELPEQGEELFLADQGRAARYLVVLESDPTGGAALDDLGALEERMPELAQRAGLRGERISFAGDTALARETVDTMTGDVLRIGLAAALVNLVFLFLFLRALVAPLYLLAASLLALAASLGLTTFVFQELLGHGHLTYFVPFAVAVLLLSLGSDYNVFVVGRIWQEAKRERLRDAVVLAAPRASRTIGIAGLALALSFAALAIVPLTSFRELAFAMCVGVLLDAFLVRALLIPALISVFGDASWWPSRRASAERAARPAGR
jgi:putative drug exporter of the RND superfamily